MAAIKRLTLLLIVPLLVTACAGDAPPDPVHLPEPEGIIPPQVEYCPELDNSLAVHSDIDQLFDEFFAKYVTVHPEHITWTRYPEDIVPRQDDKLNPYTYGHSLWLYELSANTLARLAEFDSTPLTPNQQLTKDILQWRLEDMLSRRPFMYHSYLFGPLHGPHIDLPMFMQRGHTIRSLSDAENYITRLAEFETVFAQYMWAVETQRRKGIVPPDFIIDATVGAINDFIDELPANNPLHTAFIAQVEKLEGLDEPKIEQLSAQVCQLLESVVYPVFADLAAYLEQLKGEGVNLGVWELPDGREYYSLLVQGVTTTQYTPEQIHNMAKKEADSIRAEIRQLMGELGLGRVHIAHALNQIYQQYGISESSQLLATYKQVMDELYQCLPNLFHTLPAAEVVVLPKPRYLDHFPPHYISPAMDGSRPGVFKADINTPHTIWDIQMTTAHETVPGHHLERALRQELDHAHILRNTFSFLAYSEGWATYAEGLIYEYGPYQDDQLGRFVYLVQRLWRAAVAVVDTGIHYQRWDMDRAQQYMQQMFGTPVGLTRYVSWPGQALAYFVGEMVMLDLRRQVEEALGDAFDIREFHDVILGEGAMPLEMLQQRVEEYIQSRLLDKTGLRAPAGCCFVAA